MNNNSPSNLHNYSSEIRPAAEPQPAPGPHSNQPLATQATASAPESPRPGTSTSTSSAPNPRALQAQLMRSLVASAIRERKIRADSFAAKLTDEQRAILF